MSICSVEKNRGVILQGKAVIEEKSDQLILKKVRWILNKLNLVSTKEVTKIVTGSRITYLGRSYYVEVVTAEESRNIKVEFNFSKFRIELPSDETDQNLIRSAIKHFYQEKAVEKITPRIKKISKELNLPFTGLRFRTL